MICIQLTEKVEFLNAHEIKTYPRSFKDFSWLFVSLLGSPLLSAATASNSSKGGIINKSLKFMPLDFLFVPTFDAFAWTVVVPFDDVLIVAVEIGWGKSNVMVIFCQTLYRNS